MPTDEYAAYRNPDGTLRGKPGLKTPDTLTKIYDGLRLGLHKKYAAIRAGIGVSTLYEWMEADPAVAEQVERAEAEYVEEMVSTITKSGKKNPIVAMMALERLDPGEFGRRERQILENRVSVKVNVAGIMVNQSAADALAALARALNANSEIPEEGGAPPGPSLFLEPPR